MLFQFSAISVLACYYAIYFIKLFTQSRKGTHTYHLARGKRGRTAAIELFGMIFTIATPLTELLCIFCNISRLSNWVRWMGLCISILATVIFLNSVLTMSDSWRVGVDSTSNSRLVTQGIYSWSRNPAFAAFMLLYLGCLLMFFHWGLFMISFLSALFFHLQIVLNEEPHLHSVYGEEYLKYTQRVQRYFGRKQVKAYKDSNN